MQKVKDFIMSNKLLVAFVVAAVATVLFGTQCGESTKQSILEWNPDPVVQEEVVETPVVEEDLSILENPVVEESPVDEVNN